MEQALHQLTQSKYFSPVFNAAIFDGPVRIYFSQAHEPQALRLYYQMQQQLLEAQPSLCQNLKSEGRTIFVMMYPNIETFSLCFEDFDEGAHGVACEVLGRNIVLGVRGPIQESDSDAIYSRMAIALRLHDLNFV